MINITLYTLKVLKGLHVKTELAEDIVHYLMFCVVIAYYTQKYMAEDEYPEYFKDDVYDKIEYAKTVNIIFVVDELINQLESEAENG